MLEDKLDYLLSLNLDKDCDKFSKVNKEELRLEFNRYCLNKDCYRCNEEDGKLTKAFCLLNWITENYNIQKKRGYPNFIVKSE